jgi:hypothetical protein
VKPPGCAPEVSDSVCGEKYVVVGDSLITIRPSQLSVISLRDGKVTGVVPLDDAADLLVVPDL